MDIFPGRIVRKLWLRHLSKCSVAEKASSFNPPTIPPLRLAHWCKLRRMNVVEAHYAQPGLVERVKTALLESGLDPGRLTQSELDKRDQFHVGGLDATNELLQMAAITASDRVLDLGSGAGGPSRHLAATVGCHVTGIDLTDEYCQVAKMLADSTGLSHLLDYRQGDALHTPFDNASFDAVWTQHAAMNIEDKPGLYREIFRVLKPSGRLAIHDIVAGTGEVLYPVPWARRTDFSFLISADDMKNTLETAGFRNVVSQDVTKQGLEALLQLRRAAAAPGYGLRTLMGPEFPAMLANLIANLQSGACRVVEAVCVK
jgi:MPBQ/MSBQ methyltransferase